jgi:hypothetical protein
MLTFADNLYITMLQIAHFITQNQMSVKVSKQSEKIQSIRFHTGLHSYNFKKLTTQLSVNILDDFTS